MNTIMTRNYIYINPQGVPCAPTKETTWPYNNRHESLANEQEIKDSCIPIREEDRKRMILDKFDIFDSTKDTFISVEPYQFDVGSWLTSDSNGPKPEKIRPYHLQNLAQGESRERRIFYNRRAPSYV